MALSDAQIDQLTGLLKQLESGKDVPLPVFFEFARLQCVPVLELVPLRRQEGRAEVLLIKRPADDPFFAGLWHTPGTIIRSRDGDLRGALLRLLDHELAGVSFAGPPRLVMEQLHHSKRGMESATIFYREVSDNAGIGQWHPADNLPADLIDSQRDFIQAASTQFKQDTNQL